MCYSSCKIQGAVKDIYLDVILEQCSHLTDLCKEEMTSSHEPENVLFPGRRNLQDKDLSSWISCHTEPHPPKFIRSNHFLQTDAQAQLFEIKYKSIYG